MKILITTDLYWPFVNGQSTFTSNLAHGLSNLGHEVVIIAPSPTGKYFVEQDDKLTIHRLSSIKLPFYMNYRICLNPSRRVKKVIDHFQPDVVHNQVQLAIGQATVRYCGKKFIPLVNTNHSMPANVIGTMKMLAPLSKPIKSILKKYFTRFQIKADYATFPTQTMVDFYKIDAQSSGTKIKAVSNGVDLQRFSPTKPSSDVYQKFGVSKNELVISYIGRLDIEKNLDIMIKAFAKLSKQIDCKLLLVGDGENVASLKNLVRKLNISRKVIFTGPQFGDTLADLHKIGTVFCITSTTDTQSIVTLEAMASGQPIVAVDAGALSELCVDGSNGFLCKPGEIECIAKSLYKIISNPKLRSQMSKASLELVQKHDLRNTVKQFELIYSEVIKSHSSDTT